MTTILGTITVKAGKEADFEQIARELYAVSHAEEPGLRRYDFWRAQRQGVYYVLMAFDDHRAFVEHQASEPHQQAGPRIGAVVESMDIEWIDAIDDASDLPPTDHQPAPADAHDLTVQTTERFAAVVADWWLRLR